MNAVVDIKVSVQSRVRMWDEPFRPTRTHDASWHEITTLDDAHLVIGRLANEIYAYIMGERAQNAITTTHAAVRVDNPTHPRAAAGVVPLAKAHRDIALTDEEVASATEFANIINGIIADLRKTAKY